MPKKKNKKPKKQYSQSWLVKLTIVVVLVILLKVTIGYIATARDKANFKRIEKDVLTAQSALKNINPYMNTQIKKYCHQDEEKFGGGNLNCIVELRATSSYDEEDALKSTKNNHQAIVNAGYNQIQEPNYNSLFETGSVEKKGKGEACRIYYEQSNEPKVDKKSKYTFVFKCAEQVSKFIYPNENSIN